MAPPSVRILRRSPASGGVTESGERVAALRCGLDSSNWTDASGWSDATEDAKQRKDTQIARRERCKTLTGADVSDRAPPPFGVAKAHVITLSRTMDSSLTFNPCSLEKWSSEVFDCVNVKFGVFPK